MQLYPRLLGVSEQLEKKITRLAIRSFSSFKNADDCAEKILKVVETKKKIDNLYCIINNVIKRLDDEEKAIFNYKYFKYRSIDSLSYGSRAYYRKQNKAFKRLRDLFGYIGLTEDEFIKTYSDLPCVKVIMENLSPKKKKISSVYAKEIFS